ncbi:MAG: hypothetical protein F6K42_34990, partial [Leptolyngbya sp. SIO1D8]|nr:hypothetical protein [Leptolyngbya sp. SIO1D8]
PIGNPVMPIARMQKRLQPPQQPQNEDRAGRRRHDADGKLLRHAICANETSGAMLFS